MLYILGGAARSGKSTISRKLLNEKKVPYFSIDVLISALQGAPALDIQHGQPFIEKAHKLGPFTYNLFSHLVEDEPAYLIEGDGILPEQAKKVLDQYPEKVTIAFVGYPQHDVEQKLLEVRKYQDSHGDWTLSQTDDQMRFAISDMIEFSKYLESECGKLGLPFFDNSNDFSGTLEEIYNSLIS